MPIIPDSRIANIRKKLKIDDSLYEDYCSEIEKMEINDLANDDTWHYIESDIVKNKKLIKKLDEFGLLKKENNVCDCGIGLGKTLFDIYINSKNINKKFNFYGIEKEEHYIHLFENNLRNYWKGDIKIFNEDIMDHNYSNYNIVYTYTPFKKQKDLKTFYKKIIDEIKDGSLLIEHIEDGKGMSNCLLDISKEYENLHEIKINGNSVFYKKEININI